MLTFLTILIAVVGIIFSVMLFNRVLALNNEVSLKRHRKKQAGLADLLNYASVVDDGVIINKNGSLMAAWLYKGQDMVSSTEAEREQISAIINQALVNLGNGWMIHVDAVRRSSQSYADKQASTFPDAITYEIDEERRHYFEMLGTVYESYYVLTVTWFPPMFAQQKFVELMFDDEDKAKSHQKKKQSEDLIESFKSEVCNIENRLSSAFDMTRLKRHDVVNEHNQTMSYDDFLSWLQFCITGNHQPILLPKKPTYLDSLIGGQEFWGGVIPKIGRKFIQVVAIEGFPIESSPNITHALTEIPCEYRWSSRFIFMDHHEALNHLDKFRKRWRQKVRGFFDQVFDTNSGAVDQDALSMVHDAEAAMAEVNSGEVAMGYYTSVIVLMDDDRERLTHYAQEVEKMINRLGFAARVETINTCDAYLGSLPGHGVENVRRPLMNTLNLSDLIPASSIWAGSEQAPCPWYPEHSPPLMYCVTDGATPFRLNLHVGDLGHTFMFGPTGAGKSVHLGIIAAQLRRYKGMNVFVFDKGMSMYPLTQAIGGQHYSIGSESDGLAFSPLQFLETKNDRAWASEWIDTILSLNGVQTTPAQRNEIHHALQNMYETNHHTLSVFANNVQDNEIREALKTYTVDGAMGYLLDADEDGLSFSDFSTFEIEDLMNLGEKFALPVLLYLFRRIEQSLKGQPSVIILDEAWIMLGHRAFREKIKEWLKVLRKANCLVLMATQSLSDAVNSGIFDVIVESTATKIFLPNASARDAETASLYRRMGLNDRQIDLIATAIPKQHYYYVSSQGRRLYELALGPLALALVGASDKESIAEIKKLERHYGQQWVHYWLASKNIHLDSTAGELCAS